MDLKEAIALIENDFLLTQDRPSVWADFGCGSGLFTRALCHYLHSGSRIYAVDKNNYLERNSIENKIEIIPIAADFERDVLPVNKLEGILMANSLHYVKDKYSFLFRCRQAFMNETFLIVEYDTDTPVRRWVPYPVSFTSLAQLFRSLGFNNITRLGERPSSYGRSPMYAALIR